MSTKTKLFSASLILAASLMTAGIAQAADGKPAATNNRCWGEIASQLAQYDSETEDQTDVEENGGGMGLHSRSGTAVEKNGGFANNEIAPITQPRTGVGNVSKGRPHNTHPGDGGNGQHAVNNGEFFATLIDPTTGVAFPAGDGPKLTCDSLDPNFP